MASKRRVKAGGRGSIRPPAPPAGKQTSGQESLQRAERPIREDLVRALVLEAHAAIRDEGRVADRALDFLLRREKRLYASERRAVAEAVYGLLRSEGRLDYLLESGLGAKVHDLSASAKRALSYQALRVMNERIRPARALQEGGLAASLLPGLEACAAPDEAIARLSEDPARLLEVKESLPPWIADLFLQQFGEEEAFALAATMNERAPLTIRTNLLRTDREGLRERLAAEGVEAQPTPYAETGLWVEGRRNLFQLPSFREGLFEIQDEGSQLLARLLDPRPGWLVVDACAGAGGKTLALAAMMKNRGRLVALDTDERRLAMLGPRARRAQVHNWEAQLIPEDGLPQRLLTKLEGKADAVLIDAPCTGLGVLRRNPDARYRLDPGSVARFAALQETLLLRYAALAKPGGRVVYATCSVAAEENEGVVEAVLAKNPELELVPPSVTLGEELAERLGARRYLKLLPHRHGTDGFFAALLQRR